MTTTTAQVLSDRLRELCFSEQLFSSEDTAKLKAVVEAERVALEDEFNAKFRARTAKLVTRVTVDKIISATPNGGAL
jgi:hypothetical protein